jgi:hypothetical protein
MHTGRRAAAATVLSALLAAGCNSTTDVPPPPHDFSVIVADSASGSHSASLIVGDTVRMLTRVLDVFGRPAAARVSFASRNQGVASVTNAGLIRAVSVGNTYVLGWVTGVGNALILDSIAVHVGVICTAEAKAGLVISIEDSLSGSKGPFAGVNYVAREGTAFSDSTLVAAVPAQVSGLAFSVGLAYERVGTYAVTVKATNYRPWTKSGVVVAKDACHVIPVSLVARLVPQ